MRLTIRRSMLAVLVAALALGAYRFVPFLLEILHDDPYHAIRTESASWRAGPEPAVAVDLFEGSIQVLPSTDGTVKAEMTASVVTKVSQAEADRVLESIEVMMDHRGDSVRIVTRGASEDWIWNGSLLDLQVPPGVRLDLRTGRGCIYVGRDYTVPNRPARRPIAAYSVRARNDSTYRLGHAQGNIEVETMAPRPAGGGPKVPTRLQLDATGEIEIVADSAVVEAHAWHGRPPQSWPPGSYEDETEGVITFEGSLAAGDHSLRAAHRIEMSLSDATTLRVDAEAVGGKITGDLLPAEVGPRGGRSSWSSPIGRDTLGHLRIRTDDGPIVLGSRPRSARIPPSPSTGSRGGPRPG